MKNAGAHRYRHTRLGKGVTFEQVVDSLDVLKNQYGKRSKGRQDNIDRLMLAHLRTALPGNPVTRKNGGRKLMTTTGIIWCGEGDLNPHEIAPASTSS